MNKKVNIEELAKQKLGNYSPSVPAGSWEAVQAKITANAVVGGSAVGTTLSVLPGIVAGVAVTLATLVGVQVAEEARKSNAVTTVEGLAEANSNSDELTSPVTGEETIDPQTSQETTDNNPNSIEEIGSTSEEFVTNNVRVAQSDVTFEEYAREVESGIVETTSTDDDKIDEPKTLSVTQSGIEAAPIAGDAPLTVWFNTSDVSRAQWNFGDDSPVSDEVSVEHKYTSPGTYTVTLIAQHNNGKIFQDQMIVTVGEPESDTDKIEELKPEFKVPNVFTPNADGINDYFTFEVPDGIESFEINVFNSAGRIVYRSTQTEFRWNGTDLDGSETPSGTYFYQIKAVEINHSVHAPKGSITLNR